MSMGSDPIAGFIREQPDVLNATLAETLAFASGWRSEARGGIALVGAGSSFNALATARPVLARAGCGAVTLHLPSDFASDLAEGAVGRPLVLVLSQSGASAGTVVAARAALKEKLPVLAITAERNSPLARSGAPLLVLPIGAEAVGPKTKGFLASVAALLVLAGALGAPDLPTIDGSRLAALIEPARTAAEAVAAEFAECDGVMFAGHGALYGIALEGSLKLAEMAGVPTAAWPLEEVMHGRLHGLTARGRAMLLAGHGGALGDAERIRRAMAARGGQVAVLDVSGGGTARLGTLAGPWAALAALLPLQWLAVAMAEARGLRPHAMRYPGLSEQLAIRLRTRG